MNQYQEIKVLTLYGCDIVMKVPQDRMNPLVYNPFTLEKYLKGEIADTKVEEKARILGILRSSASIFRKEGYPVFADAVENIVDNL